MTSRTHDNFRHNFWTWVDPPPQKTALFWNDGFPYRLHPHRKYPLLHLFICHIRSKFSLSNFQFGHLYANKSSKPRVYSILCGTNQRRTKATSVSCSSKLERLDGEGEMLLLAVQRVRRRRELERRGGSPFLPVLLCIKRWSGVFFKKKVLQKFMF